MVHLKSQLRALFFYRGDLILNLDRLFLWFFLAPEGTMMSLAFVPASYAVDYKVHLRCNVSQCLSEVLCVIKEGAGGESLDPVLVPEGLEDLRVESRFKEGVLQLIVLLRMQTEILHLFLRYHALGGTLTASLFLHLLDVALGEDTEAADFYLTRGHCALRINHDSDEGLLMLLIQSLSTHIDT